MYKGGLCKKNTGRDNAWILAVKINLLLIKTEYRRYHQAFCFMSDLGSLIGFEVLTVT